MNTSSQPSQDNQHVMQKNIPARPVTQQPYKEDPYQVIVDNLNVDNAPTELGNLQKTRTNINCTAHHTLYLKK